MKKLLTLIFVFSLTLVCQAQPLYYPAAAVPVDPPWTQHLIDKKDRDHDFKTVARGARTEHAFVLKNKFEETVHIAGLAASCTCTDVYVQDNKAELQTYEETRIVARFRTDLFTGPKNATLSVTIDKPYYAVIQLNVRGDIRSDLTLTPPNVRFENAEIGAEVSRTVDVAYSGSRADWKILDFKCSNEHLSAAVEDVQSRPGLTTAKVRIAQDGEMPRGQYSDYVVLLTNDEGNLREIPVLVQGTAGTVVNVTPQTVFFGFLKKGEASPVKNVIVRGTQPFIIKGVKCDNPAVDILFTPKESDPPRILYRIPVQYKNPADGNGAPKDGKMHAVVNIETGEEDITLGFNATMQIAEEQKEK
ncbi:MAG: DUF1573 domain-containing protein [Planctomycetaceae bacterium]|jgi:predicted small lipoprotein YifL|nr:DUF1573 domain-containing protein [Planctomycetaceae bacterium]